MITKKFIQGAASVVTAGALLVGGTLAYFTATDTSTGNTLGAGTLNVNVLEQNGDNELALALANLAPGETRTVNFDVKNTGTLDVFLRGYITGTWGTGNEALDAENMIHVTQVERWNGSGWEVLHPGPEVTGLFYYSPDGTDASHFTVAPDTRAQFQLTVMLDEEADNDYQGKTFTADIVAQARQTTTGATWPTP